MRRWTKLAIASLAALSLAAPDAAWAQASRRGSDSGSSGGSSSSGGSGGGGPRSSGGTGSGSAQPRSGSGSGGGGGQATASSGGSGGGAGSSGGGARARGGSAVRGEAQPREFWRPGLSRPTYIIRSYYPSYGFYDPWGYGYGYSRWARYPYGVGYGVFGYPGIYDPYFGGYGGYYGGGGYVRRDDRQDDDGRPTGSIRVRASPRTARVYIDGALVGIVDDFDGLSDHLEIEAGAHQIEIRADGYETYTSDITVRAGRTMTERASLRRIN